MGRAGLLCICMRGGFGFSKKNPSRVQGGMAYMRVGFGIGQTRPIPDSLPFFHKVFSFHIITHLYTIQISGN
ncbi:hypothetical protein LguiA_034561 [Lonicera macranthoides]